MSIADKLTKVAENTPKVYDAGYTKAESDQWDAFQNYGNKKFYEYAFSHTGFEYIRPPHKIVPTSREICMFQSMPNLKCIEKAYVDLSQCNVASQAYNATAGHYAVFSNSESLEYIEDVGMKPGGYYRTYNGCHKLHTVEVMRVIEKTEFYYPFSYCYDLENLAIEGTIGQNGFIVSYCTKLSHTSLMSIINALKDYSADTSGTSWVVTLGTENLAKLTDAEKAIATQKGWTLA